MWENNSNAFVCHLDVLGNSSTEINEGFLDGNSSIANCATNITDRDTSFADGIVHGNTDILDCCIDSNTDSVDCSVDRNVDSMDCFVDSNVDSMECFVDSNVHSLDCFVDSSADSLDGSVHGITGVQELFVDEQTDIVGGLVKSVCYLDEGDVEVSNGAINISDGNVDEF